MNPGKIEVTGFTEHEDGSATIEFEADKTAKEMLIGEGLIALIEKAVDQEQTEYEIMNNKED